MTAMASAALSLTGSGHLLVYQLGACRALLKSSIKIQHVAGSSGGAIVAALVSHNLNLEEFAQDFIQTRERGLSLLKEKLQSETTIQGPSLSICTTQCRDGQLQVFDFVSTSDDRLLQALEASCRIPPSFHPWDIISSTRSYADSEGIRMDNNDYYVDGGIAAPAPPTPPNLRRILISPIAGQSKNNDWRISPASSSYSWPSIDLKHNFGVDASFANLRALRAAMGMTTSSELKVWYQRGQDDAQRFLEDTF